MRAIIFLELIVTLSIVSCKDHQSNYRENTSPRRSKDHKNKRGIGDYPFSLPFGGPAFPSFQSANPGASSFPGYGALGAYSGNNPLSISSSPFSSASQSLQGFPSLGPQALGNLGAYGLNQGSGFNLQSLNPGYGSTSTGFNLPSSNLNLASLLSNQVNSPSSYPASSLNLFSSPDKTGPVTFTPQPSNAGQPQQQYVPVYATSTQLGSRNYAVPVIMTPSQGIALSSFTSGNGVSYSSPTTSGSSSQPVVGGYIIAAPNHQQSGSPSSLSISVPVTASSSSSPNYAISVPISSHNSPTASASSASSSSYRLPIVASAYVSSPSSAPSGSTYIKYTPASSEGSTYASHAQTHSQDTALKPSGFATSSTSYNGPLSSSNSYSSLTSSNNVPNYYNGNSGSSSSHPVTSYGTPTSPYSVPSTSYGTPSSSPSISSSNYYSQSSSHSNPSINYASSVASSSGVFKSSQNSPSSSSYQTESSYKTPNTNYGSASASQVDNNSYGSSNKGSSVEFNSNYKSPSASSSTSSSNSIETPGSLESAEIYDSAPDSGSSYSNHSPRYLRYPAIRTLSPYIENEEEVTSSGSNYDTISYSVPNGRY